MFSLDLKVKNLFFDRDAVVRSTDAKTRGALSRAGAFVRTRARTLLRRRKKVSAAGSPPSVHATNPDASLKKILFFFDPVTKSVVIGPVKLNGNPYRGQTTVPELMEFGGTVSHGGRTLTYDPRPFMAPALEAETPNLPAHWASAAAVRNSA